MTTSCPQCCAHLHGNPPSVWNPCVGHVCPVDDLRATYNAPRLAEGTGSLQWYRHYHPDVPNAALAHGESLAPNTAFSARDRVWKPWNYRSPFTRALFVDGPNCHDHSQMHVGAEPHYDGRTPVFVGSHAPPQPRHDPNPYRPQRAVLQSNAHRYDCR